MAVRIALPRTTSQTGALKKLTAILVLLVLLPTIFYSVYEVNSLTQSEDLIDRAYRQQLDAVLFSVNQYAWDIANSWASDVNQILRTEKSWTSPRMEGELREFLSSNRGIHTLFLADTSAAKILLTSPPSNDSAKRKIQAGDVRRQLQASRGLIARLVLLQETGHRNLEGMSNSDSQGEQWTVLLFVSDARPDKKSLVGLVLDSESFVREILRQKVDEAAGNEFVVILSRKSTKQIIYTTGATVPGEARQAKNLWLFPDYSLGIRLKGQTIEELVRERFYRSLFLLGILDIMIIAGAMFVYRTIRRELELAQLKSDFVSNVSHELRTPLSLIRMFGETLEMGRISSEEKKQEYYTTILRETERLTRLVNNILNFSRMESGRKEDQLADIDLNAVVLNVLSSYESHLAHHGFTVRKEITEPLPPIRADGEAVSEMLLNVIDNAIKYSDKEKALRITTGSSDQHVYVEVEDHGIGIAPSEQKKIFDKFYRVSTGSVHETKGSGLGLTLVRHMMDAHNGEVSVESQHGKGSTFRLTFQRMP